MSTKELAQQGREESAKLGKTDLAAHSGKVDFDSAPGEAFVGLNLLNLDQGDADGPFEVVAIEQKTFGAGKGAKLLTVYKTRKGTTPVQMPISASFLTKAAEAKLDVGDVFLIKRDKDFKSKEFGTENCKSYLIKVTARGGKKA